MGVPAELRSDLLPITPEVYQGWLNLIRTVYGGMDRRRRVLATLAAARTLESTCCAIAQGEAEGQLLFHRRSGRDRSGSPFGSLDEVDLAIMDFTEKSAAQPASVTENDVQRLRSLGLSDREIFDVALAVAARAFFATLIESLGTRPETPIVEALEPELLEALTVGRPGI